MLATICPLCHKKPSGLKGVLRVHGYTWCASCHLGWKSEVPDITYKATYYHGKSTLATRIFGPIAEFFYWIRNHYVSGGQAKLWIDVGAGEGGYLNTVKSVRKIGVEISAVARDQMHRNNLETLTNSQYLQSRKLNADVISFWHVLEHVDAPWKYLEAAKRNLRPSGRIICGIPNIDSIEARLFGLLWFHLVPRYHLWQFSLPSFKRLLVSCGFSIVSIDYWSIEHQPAGILQSLINSTAGSEAVLQRLVKRSDGNITLTVRDIFWCVFWLSIGLPVVLVIWAASALSHRSSTFVIVAKTKN